MNKDVEFLIELKEWRKKDRKKERKKKSNCSNDPYSTYLQDFFTVIFTVISLTFIWVASGNYTTEDCQF